MKESDKTQKTDREREVLTVSIRSDLYRAFRRCAWMLIHETGKTPNEAYDALFESLLKEHEC